jgi:GWxTD domain-containing protein
MMKKLLVLLFCSLATFVFADKYDKWLDEEVKVIITKEEKDAFKKLKSETEKQQFVDQFWAKRDPTPGTPENEYRKEFERRLQFVNDKMKGSNTKAVDSPMGQTYLLLGDPDEQKTDQEDPPGQTWIYKKLPKEISPGEFQVQFEGDEENGGYKFVEPNEAHNLLDRARGFYSHLGSVATAQQPAQQTQTTQKPAEAPTAAVTTPALKTALDATATGSAPKDVPFNSTVDFFMSSTDEPFATVAIDTAADAATAKVGIRILDASGATVKEMELPFANAEESAGYFQTGTPVTPAAKSAVIAVAAGDKTGGAKHELSVPDTSGFSMSSVILAKAFKQLTEAKPEKVPYTFGKIKVQPSIDRVFTKTDDLIIVYEAYNFQIDSATGKPNLEIVFTFQKGEDKPKQTPPAPPNGLVTGKKITIPTSFPLANFPPGDYKLTLTLTDKATNQTAVRETNFTVK